MTLAALSAILRGASPLGHFVWWSGPSLGAPAPKDVRAAWTRPGLPPVSGDWPGSVDQTMAAWLGLPVLERSGVFWLAPGFSAPLEALRAALGDLGGWELHTVPVRATSETLAALRASALHATERSLGALTDELEALLGQPRARASLLVRQHDALEDLRQRAGLHQRHLGLELPSLAPRLDAWAQRIDAALCARIVA